MELKPEDIVLSIIKFDWDYEEVHFNLFDLYKKEISFKDIIENSLLEDEDLQDVDCETEEEDIIFVVKKESICETLKNLNLNLLKENYTNWDEENPNYTYSEENLMSCSEWIYCNNDNSDYSELKINKKFLESLSVGDKLVLKGSAVAEHC